MSGGAGPYGAATRIGMVHEFRRTLRADCTLTTHRDKMVETGKIDDGRGDRKRNVKVRGFLDDLHQARGNLYVLLVRFGRRRRRRRRHWGQGSLETGRNMSGTLKGEEPFTCHVTINSRSVTFHMYFQMFLTLSLTNNQSSHFHPSLNVPTMYPRIPYRLHLSQ